MEAGHPRRGSGERAGPWHQIPRPGSYRGPPGHDPRSSGEAGGSGDAASFTSWGCGMGLSQWTCYRSTLATAFSLPRMETTRGGAEGRPFAGSGRRAEAHRAAPAGAGSPFPSMHARSRGTPSKLFIESTSTPAAAPSRFQRVGKQSGCRGCGGTGGGLAPSPPRILATIEFLAVIGGHVDDMLSMTDIRSQVTLLCGGTTRAIPRQGRRPAQMVYRPVAPGSRWC